MHAARTARARSSARSQEIRALEGSLETAGAQVYVAGPGGQLADLVKAFGGIDGILLLVALGAVLVILLVVYRSPVVPFLVLFSAGLRAERWRASSCTSWRRTTSSRSTARARASCRSSSSAPPPTTPCCSSPATARSCAGTTTATRRCGSPGGVHARAGRRLRRHGHPRPALPAPVRPRPDPGPRPGRRDRHRRRDALRPDLPAGGPRRPRPDDVPASTAAGSSGRASRTSAARGPETRGVWARVAAPRRHPPAPGVGDARRSCSSRSPSGCRPCKADGIEAVGHLPRARSSP